jgi:hypothetical protein
MSRRTSTTTSRFSTRSTASAVSRELGRRVGERTSAASPTPPVPDSIRADATTGFLGPQRRAGSGRAVYLTCDMIASGLPSGSLKKAIHSSVPSACL